MLIRILTTTKVTVVRDVKLNVDKLITETILPVVIYDREKLIRQVGDMFNMVDVDIVIEDK